MVFGIILVVSVYTGIQTKVLGKSYTDFFGLSLFEVQTGSMKEAIDAGDWIIVKQTRDVRVNDIVTYELSGEYITHRVVEAYSNAYVTKGDANNAKDNPINKNQVIGKVIKVLPNFGVVRKILFNPLVFLTLILTLFLINISFDKGKSEEVKIIFFKIIRKITYVFNKYISTKIKTKINNIKEKNEEKKIIENSKIMAEDKKIDYSERTEKIYDFSNYDEDYEEENALDKTTLLRVISVDSSEVDNTLLEIANNEIKDDKSEAIKVETTNVEEIVDDELESEATLTKINLELLKSKANRKGKNIIDSMIVYKIDELEEIINVLNETKTYVNKPSIRNLFISIYIDARYYNYYEDREVDNSKNRTQQIEKIIKEVATKLINKYKGLEKKYNQIVWAYANSLILIANFEQAKDSIIDIKIKRKFYKKELLKNFKDLNSSNTDEIVERIIKIQRNYVGVLEYFLKKFETNMFELKFNKLNSRKEMYGIELKHNINFSKVYSDYIIDKTYSEGIIAEDKMAVLLSLLLIHLIKDMCNADFDKEYILPFPASLYTKEKKYEKFLRMIEDKHAKDSVIILIDFEDLANNKSFVREIKKEGYRFAIVFNKDVEVKEKDYAILNIMDYAFINKKKVNAIKLLAYLPEDILDNIIYDDIIEKVGEVGSEE
jgi:signal peptidase I